MIVFRLPRHGIRLFSLDSVLFVLWLFLLVFPKGGIKVASIPLTWGYLLLGIASIGSILRARFRCHTKRLYAFLATLPFQMICMFSFLIHGIGHIGFAISLMFGFCFFPWCFFVVFSEFLESLNLSLLYKLLRKGVLFVATYGIFLFFFKIATGKFIEIPFLTTNFHDLQAIDLKHIDRGTVFKLISTYNNGNLYGICILMLLPLYLLIESSIWKKNVVILSLILSLSRTVWVGLLFNEVILSLFGYKQPAYLKLLRNFVVISLGIVSISHYFGFSLSFLFDPTLGGRIGQLHILSSVTILPSAPFHGMSEMVYLGILSNFGIIGLFAYLLCLCSPFFLTLVNTPFPLTVTHKRILCGLANFLFVSISDGALLYIPILAFYWFLSTLALRSKSLCFASITKESNSL